MALKARPAYPDEVDGDTPREVARAAESSDALRILARGGSVAIGVVNAVTGAIILAASFGGGGEADPSGAVRMIAAAPAGVVALWLIAITLWALAIWRVLDGVLEGSHAEDGVAAAKKWARRLSVWGQALVSVALGGVAAAVALGARPDGESSVESASRDVLSIVGGQVLLGIVGVAIGIGGVAFVWTGASRRFRRKLSLPSSSLRTTVTTLGVIGYVAKGAALVIIGVLLVVAAVTLDPQAAAGLDGAVQTMLALPYGPWLVRCVGIGLIAYGGFWAFRARYVRP